MMKASNHGVVFEDFLQSFSDVKPSNFDLELIQILLIGFATLSRIIDSFRAMVKSVLSSNLYLLKYIRNIKHNLYYNLRDLGETIKCFI